MNLIVNKTDKLHGEIVIPASKSHTIRAIIMACLARGRSELINPLFSEDTKAAINACRALGARIERRDGDLVIDGFGSVARTPDRALNMLNSGTSTNLVMGLVAALGITAEITGDESLCSRPVNALAEALSSLGCQIEFLGQKGCPPLRLSGRMTGRKITIDAAKSSQYVSSLLIACPLLSHDTEITVLNPTELPYIALTLSWLDRQNIKYEKEGFTFFKIFGNQSYKPFRKAIPSDWSSATFPICAAALTDSDLFIKGVDIDDVQGDKALIDYLKSMGAAITSVDGGLRIEGNPLDGKTLDINATPDALPALAVIGCFARGRTKLFNVAQARVKETDRITVMATELAKMGADIQELPDGLLIGQSFLKGGRVNGHHDHRVVMALSLAALTADSPTTIETAEAVAVTYPDYIDAMKIIGANFTLQEEVSIKC